MSPVQVDRRKLGSIPVWPGLEADAVTSGSLVRYKAREERGRQ